MKYHLICIKYNMDNLIKSQPVKYEFVKEFDTEANAEDYMKAKKLSKNKYYIKAIYETDEELKYDIEKVVELAEELKKNNEDYYNNILKE